jgi:hypothetical protein
MSSTLPAASPSPSGPGDGRAPRTPPERIGLLFLLVILPVALVTLPAILVTAIFGQHPRVAPAREVALDDSGLRSALEHDAQQAMPAPSAIGEEPIVLTVRPDRLAARIQRIGELAKSLGGSMSEGLPHPDGADLYIDLPAGAAGSFRSALVPASPAAAGAETSSGKVHLEVTIRIARDDE